MSSALDEAASALNKLRSEAVTKGDLSSECVCVVVVVVIFVDSNSVGVVTFEK